MKIFSKLGAGLVGLCALLSTSIFAEPKLTNGFVEFDTGTKGSWMGVYGECYNVLSQASPRKCIPEVQVGPDFQGDQPQQYINVMVPNCDIDPDAQPEFSEAVCITGEATDNFDVRVYVNNNPNFPPGETHAFAWGFDEPGTNPPGPDAVSEVEPGTSQDNACKDVLPAGLHSPDAVYASTFDSEDYSYDPLSAEIKLTLGGETRVAYYFLSEAAVCRSADFKLYVNDIAVFAAEGTVEDISKGKYVIFDLMDIPDNARIRLDVTEGQGTCQDATIPGPNSHLSGIFVDGTNACRDPFCGDGNVDRDLGETCEMPGDQTNDGGICREDCTYCGDGIVDSGEECDPGSSNGPACSDTCEIIEAPSRTLGYWKNHRSVIDGTFDGPDGRPSLVPLDFCGRTLDTCKAIKYLRKGGGGLNKFKRQGVAAALNCKAFGCPREIESLFEEGSATCEDNFGRTGRIFGDFNEANDDLPLPFKSPKAQPKWYERNCL